MAIEAPAFGAADRFRVRANGRKGRVVTVFWSERHRKTAYIVFYERQRSIRLIWNLEQVADKLVRLDAALTAC